MAANAAVAASPSYDALKDRESAPHPEEPQAGHADAAASAGQPQVGAEAVKDAPTETEAENEVLFGESDTEQEDHKPPSMSWVFVTIVLAILILCFVLVLVLIYIGTICCMFCFVC